MKRAFRGRNHLRYARPWLYKGMVFKQRMAEVRMAGLLRKYPEMSELRWRSYSLSEAPHDAICRVIQDAWRRAYGDRIRIAYEPALLRYAAACSRASGLVTTAEDAHGVCGVLLGLPLDCALHGADHGPVTLTTGLSTTARWEGSGLVEMLLAQHALNLSGAGHAFHFHWRSTALQTAQRSRDLAHAATIPLYAKALHCAKAARFGQLSWWQGLGLRWVTWRHSRPIGLPSGCSIERYREEHAAEAMDFLTAFQPQNSLRRVYYPETFTKQCTFSEGGLSGVGWILRDGGHLAGIGWGYVNPVSGDNAYFSLDGMVFHPECIPARRAAFVRAVEEDARDALGCFAIMTLGSVCREPLPGVGYLAVRQYHIGAMAYQDIPSLTCDTVGDAFLELR